MSLLKQLLIHGISQTVIREFLEYLVCELLGNGFLEGFRAFPIFFLVYNLNLHDIRFIHYSLLFFIYTIFKIVPRGGYTRSSCVNTMVPL